jgi:hypothetical protein
MGTFPDAAITRYLARSASALYAFHGVILAAISLDVRRHAPLIRCLGWCNIVFGVTVLGIDLTAAMPWCWTAAEGPLVVLFGVVMLVLERRLRPWGGDGKEHVP